MLYNYTFIGVFIIIDINPLNATYKGLRIRGEEFHVAFVYVTTSDWCVRHSVTCTGMK